MKYRLLIGDTIDHMGKNMANTIKYLGFETVYCSNYTDTLEKMLNEEHFDGCIFYALVMNENIRSFIRNCRNSYPQLKLYAIIATVSDSVRLELLKLGVTECIVMPYINCIACTEIAVDFYPELKLLPEIAEFLFKKKFPSTLIGFYFLCTAVKILIDNPETADYGSTELYTAIAEKINNTYDNVERGLRVMLSSAFRKGVIIKNKIENRRMKNKDLIILLAEEFRNTSYENL
ncbi:MAG: hypothetical protein IKK66_06190 [Ruminococcus sp.]|nr:hypothetical protein [Ruminococcus sp.]